jgi:hypothetical protein
VDEKRLLTYSPLVKTADRLVPGLETAEVSTSVGLFASVGRISASRAVSMSAKRANLAAGFLFILFLIPNSIPRINSIIFHSWLVGHVVH